VVRWRFDPTGVVGDRQFRAAAVLVGADHDAYPSIDDALAASAGHFHRVGSYVAETGVDSRIRRWHARKSNLGPRTDAGVGQRRSSSLWRSGLALSWI
jgi:hypothetical protein